MIDRNERVGSRFRRAIWKLWRFWEGMVEGEYPLYRTEENASHILLNCSE